MYENDVHKIFHQESREKKRIAVGVHHRASRKGFIRGGIKTAYDFMTTKERKKLNGEVRVYNMYDNYKKLVDCNLEEILKKDDNQIKNILTTIKANNTCTGICKALSISNGKLYNLYKKYGVVYNEGGSNNSRKKKNDDIDLSEILISKQRFNLMDTIQKGAYVSNITSQYEISLSKIADFMKSNKNNIAYCVSMYRKKKGDKEGVQEMENLQQKQNEIIVEDLKEEIQIEDSQQNEPIISEINDSNNIELQKKIEELENINKAKEEEFQKKLEEINNENKIKEEELKNRIIEIENTNKKIEENNKELTDKLLTLTTNPSTKLKIELNGEYSKEDLSNRLLSLDNMILENNTYKVRIVLEEL